MFHICRLLEVRAVAACGIYKPLTIHCLAALATKLVLLHNQSTTEMVTLFGKAGTGYCAIIARQWRACASVTVG